MNLFAAFKAYFTAKRIVSAEIKEAKAMNGSKPGWKTTEFWMSVMVQAGVLWSSVRGFVPPKTAAIVEVAGAAVYTIARTITKAVSDIQAAKAGAAPLAY